MRGGGICEGKRPLSGAKLVVFARNDHGGKILDRLGLRFPFDSMLGVGGGQDAQRGQELRQQSARGSRKRIVDERKINDGKDSRDQEGKISGG